MEGKERRKRKERGLSSFVSSLGNLYNRVSQINDREIDENEELIQSVIEAHEEWQDAERFFHSVAQDPDLIDHAIYKLEASRARYIYLLKLAKASGAKVDFLS